MLLLLYFEYVYYYYDENGVNGTLIDVKPANSLTKFQNISAVNIHTNSGNRNETRVVSWMSVRMEILL